MQIDSSNTRIAKNTIYLYIRMIVSLCISLYTSRAFLDALGVEDYGIYNVVGGFVLLLSVFTNTIAGAAQRFITFQLGKGNQKQLNETFSTFLTLLLLLSIVILIFGEVFGLFFLDNYLVIPAGRNNVAHLVFHCSVFMFILNLISVPYMACVVAHEHMDFYAIISLLESFLRLFVAIILYRVSFDRLATYAILLLVISMIIRVTYSLYCKHYFEESHSHLKINKEISKEVFSYSIWVSIGASSSVLKEQGVNVLINLFFGVAMNAARGISSQIYGVVMQFANGIGQAITPQITKSYAEGNLKRAINLTFFLSKAQSVMLMFIIIPLIIETDYILGLWLVNVPDYAIIFTRWTLILCFARKLEDTHGPIFLATGRVRNLQIVGGGIMLLNVPLSYFALKCGCAPESTMIIGILIELKVMFIAYLFLNKMIGFPIFRYYRMVVLPILIVILLSCMVPCWISILHFNVPFLRLCLVIITSVFSVSVFSYFIIFSRSEQSLIREYLNKIKKKFIIHKTTLSR